MREVEHYGRVLRETLAELAPDGRSDPCIALLTPGVWNSAFYEHMFLAREIGAALVEGRDLLVEDGYVYMRTVRGLRRVDVIYRRVDDDFLDPSSSVRTPCSACPGCCTPSSSGAWPWRTRRERGWPTTRASTPSCPT